MWTQRRRFSSLCLLIRPTGTRLEISHLRQVLESRRFLEKFRADLPASGAAPHRLDIRQQRRQQSDSRQERTHAIHKLNAGRVGKLPKDRRAEPRKSEREPKEETRNRAHLARHEFL